tara:strand:- start:926 stop:1177 length:252 start_codon:yes stop_codon:yes gene_type:complete
MAKLIRGDEEVLVEEGSSLIDAAEKLGVNFGCRSGRCLTCMTEILEGEDNFEEKNGAEKMANLPKGCRLMCQAKIKGGEVLLK